MWKSVLFRRAITEKAQKLKQVFFIKHYQKTLQQVEACEQSEQMFVHLSFCLRVLWFRLYMFTKISLQSCICHSLHSPSPTIPAVFHSANYTALRVSIDKSSASFWRSGNVSASLLSRICSPDMNAFLPLLRYLCLPLLRMTLITKW